MEPTFQSAPPPDPAQMAQAQQRLMLEAQMVRGVNWFFWIAGLSLVNSVIYLFGGDLSFVVGLGATLVVDVVVGEIAKELGSGAGFIRAIGFGINLAIMALFALFGWLGRQRQRWAMVVGMILYLLDGLIFLAFGDFLPVVFHGLALWGLWRGLSMMNALKALEQSAPAGLSTSAFTPAIQPERPASPRLGLMIVSGLVLFLTCALLAGAAVVLLLFLPSR